LGVFLGFFEVFLGFFEVILGFFEVFLGVFLERVGACLEDLVDFDREWLPRFAPDWVANANRSC
jgi:hypothetical protein